MISNFEIHVSHSSLAIKYISRVNVKNNIFCSITTKNKKHKKKTKNQNKNKKHTNKQNTNNKRKQEKKKTQHPKNPKSNNRIEGLTGRLSITALRLIS